jgi:hypothetical protein
MSADDPFARPRPAFPEHGLRKLPVEVDEAQLRRILREELERFLGPPGDLPANRERIGLKPK